MDVIKIIRALTRPILTLMGLMTVSALVCNEIEVPLWYTSMVMGMIAWWFYDRSKFHSNEE